jgi:hypothetical protein
VIDYHKIVRVIKATARCSSDEAWSGLAVAFLSLDRSRTEREQVYYLCRYGRLAVIDEVRKKYIDESSGTERFSPIDESTIAGDASATEYDFLETFPEGLVREFATRLADGTSSFTAGSVSHWLRKTYNINSRSSVKGVLHGTRISAERLL